MHLIIVAILLLACLVERSRVAAESVYCSQAQSLARLASSTDQCNCPIKPTCVGCIDGGNSGTYDCFNECFYCDSTLGICGAYGVEASYVRTEIFLGNSWVTRYFQVFIYSWTYTKGRIGNFLYTYTTEGTCRVEVNGVTCKSCTLYTCNNYKGLEPAIDCSNIEGNANDITNVPCTGRVWGGWTSLDDSALAGVLAPLAMPYIGCQMGTTHIATDVEALGKPTPKPSRKPTRKPTKKPTRKPTRKPTAKPLS